MAKQSPEQQTLTLINRTAGITLTELLTRSALPPHKLVTALRPLEGKYLRIDPAILRVFVDTIDEVQKLQKNYGADSLAGQKDRVMRILSEIPEMSGRNATIILTKLGLRGQFKATGAELNPSASESNASLHERHGFTVTGATTSAQPNPPG